MNTFPRCPLPISVANSHGAMTPPKNIETAKKNEIAWARISIGKISLTVRYADDAAADAMKKMTTHSTVWVTALSAPSRNSHPVTNRMTAEVQYVPPIMTRRPTVSKKRPRISGPSRLPTADGKMKYATAPAADPVELGEDEGIREEDRVVQERLGDHEHEAEEGAAAVVAEQDPGQLAVPHVLAPVHLDRLVLADRVEPGPARLDLPLDPGADPVGLLRVPVGEQPPRALRDVPAQPPRSRCR